jgi:nucleotide-binding universal stress UspA family protein
VCIVLQSHLQSVEPFLARPLHDAASLAHVESAVRDRVVNVTKRARAAFEVFVDQGSAYAEIVRRAEHWRPDLLVVGSHGHTGLKRILLGSVAERVTRYAPCAVLVARPGAHASTVVAATDLSDVSLPALTAGRDEAARRHAALVVVHAVDIEPTYAMAGLPFGGVPLTVSAEVLRDVQAAASTMLTTALKSAKTTAEARVVAGDAAAAIVNEAETRDAELVVVGTHGRTGLARVALGSVAEKVVRAAPCSILVVRLEPRR